MIDVAFVSREPIAGQVFFFSRVQTLVVTPLMYESLCWVGGYPSEKGMVGLSGDC